MLVQIQPGAPHAPVADGEASGFQTRDWVFESPPGCQPADAEAAEAAVRKTALSEFESRLLVQYGGVDELLKSPVPKTGVRPARVHRGLNSLLLRHLPKTFW